MIGPRTALFVTTPGTVSVTTTFVNVTLPQLVTVPLKLTVPPGDTFWSQVLVMSMQGDKIFEHVWLQELVTTVFMTRSIPLTRMISVVGTQGLGAA